MKPNWTMTAVTYVVRQAYLLFKDARPPVGSLAGRPRGDRPDH